MNITYLSFSHNLLIIANHLSIMIIIKLRHRIQFHKSSQGTFGSLHQSNLNNITLNIRPILNKSSIQTVDATPQQLKPFASARLLHHDTLLLYGYPSRADCVSFAKRLLDPKYFYSESGPILVGRNQGYTTTSVSW